MKTETIRIKSFEENLFMLLDALKFDPAEEEYYLRTIRENDAKKTKKKDAKATTVARNNNRKLKENLASIDWKKSPVPYGEFFWKFTKKSRSKSNCRGFQQAAE